jgi:hypothetical protein
MILRIIVAFILVNPFIFLNVGQELVCARYHAVRGIMKVVEMKKK